MKKRTSQTTNGNGQRASARDRQASLIAAAASLFAAKGFNGTTTKEIAKAAGVSEALVFKYFPTKRSLYAAILEEKVSVNELLEAVEAAAQKHDDHRVFTMIASYRIRPGVDSTFLRLLLFSALEGHELSELFFGKHHKVVLRSPRRVHSHKDCGRRVSLGRLPSGSSSVHRHGRPSPSTP
jgi:AcrR family transcriptional regulator